MKRKMVRFIADHKQKLKKLLPKKLLRAAKLAYLKRLMAKYQKEPIHPAEYQKRSGRESDRRHPGRDRSGAEHAPAGE